MPKVMKLQPPENGRNTPQQLSSRMQSVGPKKPMKLDPIKSASVRIKALKKQREAMR